MNNLNKDIISLHAKALSNISRLAAITGLNYPKANLSHQKLLEFISKSFGFNSFKAATVSQDQPQFDYDVFSAEYPSILLSPPPKDKPKNEALSTSVKYEGLKYLYENFLRTENDPKRPFHNDIAKLLAHLNFPFNKLSDEAKNVIEFHIPKGKFASPGILEIFLFCHIISTRDKEGDEPHLVKPFKASHDEIKDMNSSLAFHFGDLFKTSPDHEILYIQPHVCDFLEDYYSTKPEPVLKEEQSIYFTFVELLGVTTEPKEGIIDKEVFSVAKPLMAVFDKYKMAKGTVDVEGLKALFKRNLNPGLYAVNRDMYVRPRTDPIFRLSVLSSIVQMIDISFRGENQIDENYSLYLNTSGFLKFHFEKNLNEMLKGELGLDVNDASYIFTIKALYFIHGLAQPESKPFVDDYKDYILNVIGKMLREGKGLNNPEAVRSQVIERWENKDDLKKAGIL